MAEVGVVEVGKLRLPITVVVTAMLAAAAVADVEGIAIDGDDIVAVVDIVVDEASK